MTLIRRGGIVVILCGLAGCRHRERLLLKPLTRHIAHVVQEKEGVTLLARVFSADEISAMVRKSGYGRDLSCVQLTVHNDTCDSIVLDKKQVSLPLISSKGLKEIFFVDNPRRISAWYIAVPLVGGSSLGAICSIGGEAVVAFPVMIALTAMACLPFLCIDALANLMTPRDLLCEYFDAYVLRHARVPAGTVRSFLLWTKAQLPDSCTVRVLLRTGQYMPFVLQLVPENGKIVVQSMIQRVDNG